MKKKAVFTWSGGKDSTLALYEALTNLDYDIVALVTTVTCGFEQISMHGVREDLLDQQAASIGIPLHKVYISQESSNEEYEKNLTAVLCEYKAQGIIEVLFGDLYLADVRKYREDNLAKIDMQASFPLWAQDTSALAEKFITLGFKTIITCVDTKQLDGTFSGRVFDSSFLSDLPSTVDPCGENGEFHSFVYDGPLFSTPIVFQCGEQVLREDRFMYSDLMPINKEEVVR